MTSLNDIATLIAAALKEVGGEATPTDDASVRVGWGTDPRQVYKAFRLAERFGQLKGTDSFAEWVLWTVENKQRNGDTAGAAILRRWYRRHGVAVWGQR